MRYGQHLYRRSSGIYVCRLYVPDRLRARFGKGELHISTGTQQRAPALIAASHIRLQWLQCFQELTALDLLGVVDGSPLLAGDGLLSIAEAAAVFGMKPETLAAELAQQNIPLFCYAGAWTGYAVDDLEEVEKDGAHYILNSAEKVGTACTVTGLVELHHATYVAQELQQAGAAHLTLVRWLDHAPNVFLDFSTPPVGAEAFLAKKKDLEALRIAYKATITLPAIAEARTLRKSASRGTKPAAKDDGATMPVSELIEKYISFKTKPRLGEQRGAWKPDEIERQRGRLSCFVEFMGDVKVNQVNDLEQGRRIIEKYVAQLQKLPTGPALRKARNENPGATAPQLVEWADRNNAQRMKTETVREYAEALSQCFRWAMGKDKGSDAGRRYMDRNPVLDVVGGAREKTARPDQAREAFTDDELLLIFGAEWFQLGGGRVTARGEAHRKFRPFHYWIPLLAYYTGGRANELAQLYLSDIQDGEAPHISFQLDAGKPDKLEADDADEWASPGDKSLKTVNSSRIVPIHRRLLELGFLDYVAALREQGFLRLFPELRFDKIKGYGLDARKWFNERFLGEKLKIERNGKKTLHSLRHNFATAIDRAYGEQADRVQRQLLGHSRGDSLAQKRYTKDREAGELQGYINALPLTLPYIAPFDIAGGLRAVQLALAQKKRNGTVSPTM